MVFNNGLDSLAPLALAIVSLTIIVSVGSIVLVNMQPVAYDTTAVDQEVHQPEDTLPTTFTVDNVFQGLVENSETLWLDETGDGNDLISLEEGTDYEVQSYENGEIELKDSTTLSSYSTTDGDEILVSYEYQEESSASGVFETANNAIQTFADFFTVIVVIGIAAVLFLLLGAVRNAGARGMA